MRFSWRCLASGLLLTLTTASAWAAEIEHHLVDVRSIYPAILQEIRYATPYNFTGVTLYPFPAAFVHEDLIAPLKAVQQELAAEGLGLKIFDGYRPLSVQAKMWAVVPDERYVSDPQKSRGRHPRGVAVDVTLVDHLGNELAMPTPFDAFTTRAHRDSTSWTDEERRNVAKLEAAMTRHGFVPFPYEWWHYDFAGWEKYPPFDISFDALVRGVKTAEPKW